MARPQTFATVDAVRAARAVFWRHGYEDASLPDLESATGLRRSSLYNTFGNKRGLFDAAVANYLEEVVHPRLAPLLAADVAPEALPGYFAGLRAGLLAADDDRGDQGCLLLNTAAAPIGHDEAVRGVVDGYTDLLETALGHGVASRWPGLSAAAAGLRTRTLLAFLVTALLLARVDVSKAVAALDDALSSIRAWPSA